MIDVLSRWNLWGSGSLQPGIARDLLPALTPFLHSPEVVALTGARRAGKTTVLFQLMESLTASGVAPEAFLHVNFEEPRLGPELGPALLDLVFETYRHEVYPVGRAFLFLDEVQYVPGWERWVRARSQTEEIKVIVTGSSSAMMSRELASLLTGRHVAFEITPLSFREHLRFKNVEIPAKPKLTATPAPIGHALLEYLQWGGFPEVVLAEDAKRKEALLKQYFDDLLFKDVALRHQVRDVATLRNVAVHLLTQTACPFTHQRLARTFGTSLDLARTYVSYLEEAYLVRTLPFFSLKSTVRQRNPSKVHAVDTGLRNAVCLSGSPDRGRLAETTVHNTLCARGKQLFHWKGNNEVDLLVRQGNRIERLIQVVWEGLDRPAVHDRELAGLVEGGRKYPRASLSLIAGSAPPANSTPAGVAVELLWRFLLGEPPTSMNRR